MQTAGRKRMACSPIAFSGYLPTSARFLWHFKWGSASSLQGELEVIIKFEFEYEKVDKDENIITREGVKNVLKVFAPSLNSI